MSLGLTLALTVGVGALHLPGFDPSGATPAVTARAAAQEPLASPDTFDWHLYGTSHFDIYYYPALTDDLERIEEAAELAYTQVSAALEYNLAFRVPLILFKTRDEFEQQDIAPGARVEWVTAFSEPGRNRIVVLVDGQDQLAVRIAHELTHVVAFDIIPRSPPKGTPQVVPHGTVPLCGRRRARRLRGRRLDAGGPDPTARNGRGQQRATDDHPYGRERLLRNARRLHLGSRCVRVHRSDAREGSRQTVPLRAPAPRRRRDRRSTRPRRNSTRRSRGI